MSNNTGIVVASVGVGALILVFAGLALYGVDKYKHNAFAAEAREGVTQMAQKAKAAFERDRRLCPSATQPVPSEVSVIRGQKHMSSPAEWRTDAAANAGFACLDFSWRDPQYYQFSYRATGPGAPGDRFTATAIGDLDGDGELSTFSLSGEVGPDGKLHVDERIEETDWRE